MLFYMLSGVLAAV